MSSNQKSAGGRAATDSAAQTGSILPPPAAAGQDDAQQGASLWHEVSTELACLREAAADAERLACVMRYVHSAVRVFDDLDSATKRDPSLGAALDRSCRAWRDSGLMSGLDHGLDVLASDLHTRLCMIVDGLHALAALGDEA